MHCFAGNLSWAYVMPGTALRLPVLRLVTCFAEYITLALRSFESFEREEYDG